jgi:hypothetical protein
LVKHTPNIILIKPVKGIQTKRKQHMSEQKKSRRDEPRILVYVRPDLYKKFKIYCIQNDIKIQSLFDQFIVDYCSKIEA